MLQNICPSLPLHALGPTYQKELLLAHKGMIPQEFVSHWNSVLHKVHESATSEPDGRPPPLHPNPCDDCQRCKGLFAPLPPHTLPICIAPPEDTSAISNTAKIHAGDVDAEDAISDANQLFLHEWLAQERPSIYIQESNKYLMEVHTAIYIHIYIEIHT